MSATDVIDSRCRGCGEREVRQMEGDGLGMCKFFTDFFWLGGTMKPKDHVFFCDDHVFQEFPRSQIKFSLAEIPGFMMV